MRALYTTILFVFLAIAAPADGFAQNMGQGEPSQELEQQARETAERWGRELALSPKQVSLMERNYIEYALKKDAIIQLDISKEEKDRRLKEVQIDEHNAMRDVLTKPKFERYIALSTQENDENQDANRP